MFRRKLGRMRSPTFSAPTYCEADTEMRPTARYRRRSATRLCTLDRHVRSVTADQIVRLKSWLVDDVERVAQCFVDASAWNSSRWPTGCSSRASSGMVMTLSQLMTHTFGQAVFSTEFDLGADSSDGACDGRTGHRGQDRKSGIPGQHAHRSATSRRTEVSPEDVVTRYHAGVV